MCYIATNRIESDWLCWELDRFKSGTHTDHLIVEKQTQELTKIGLKFKSDAQEQS